MKRSVLFLLFVLVASGCPAEEYRFQPGDWVDIFVYNEENMTGEFRITGDGDIRVPLVGKVRAAGLTEDELYDVLVEAIGEYINDPHITVTPKFSVSVMGYVRQPGVFTISDSMRLVEVLALAGGLQPDASGDLEIYRKGEKIRISRKNILESDAATGFAMPGDVIIARKKLFTRGDYSIILSTVTAISLAIYYTTRD